MAICHDIGDMDASTIIKTLGGRAKVAEATKSDPNTVLYWERRGRIPSRHWPALISVAELQQIQAINAQVLVSHQTAVA